ERSAPRSTTTRSRGARETMPRPVPGERLAADRSGSGAEAGTSFWGTSVFLRARRSTAITIGTARWWFGQRGDRSCADRGRRQCRSAGTRRPCSITPPLTLALAGLSFPLFSASLAAALASLRGTTLPLGPRLDHRQRDPLTLLIDAHHPNRHHVAHTHH